VAEVGAVVAARAANRAMMNCKDDRVALIRIERFDAGLLARALLGEDKFAAFKIFAALAQKEGDLKRKDDFTV
jgi:hypothetical protein